MLLSTQTRGGIGELDVELLGALDNELASLGADGVRNLAAEELVLHEQKVELLKAPTVA